MTNIYRSRDLRMVTWEEMKIGDWNHRGNWCSELKIYFRVICHRVGQSRTLFFEKFRPLSLAFWDNIGRDRVVRRYFNHYFHLLASRFPEKFYSLLRYVIFHTSALPWIAIITKWFIHFGSQCADPIGWNVHRFKSFGNVRFAPE
jgi:hypothetical protein